MLSPNRIQPNNTNKRVKKVKILILTTILIVFLTSKDLKGPQTTSKDLNRLQTKLVRK